MRTGRFTDKVLCFNDDLDSNLGKLKGSTKNNISSHHQAVVSLIEKVLRLREINSLWEKTD